MGDGVEPLWASGPSELLRHGLTLLAKESDLNTALGYDSDRQFRGIDDQNLSWFAEAYYWTDNSPTRAD